MGRFDWIGTEAFRQVDGRLLRVTRACAAGLPFAAVDPDRLSVEVEAGVEAALVVLHGSPDETSIDVRLAEGASLALTEIFVSEAFVECRIRQEARSRCSVMTAMFSSANVRYRTDLDGAGAESELDGVFVAGGDEHCVVELRTAHNVPDCRSRSAVKGVAGGRALGEFRGLVYVAPDAQRTDARQQSRNVLLGAEARIDTKPQLEIYADDVKCTHGATVGMMDNEAILYMRQRGLSLQQARSLQIEGFVDDIVLRCPLDAVREALVGAVAEKLEKM
ncbi:MAG: SufD family Fe-S cluster assembly protein [Alistipes sp.]|jgi:ABC-type transport system involved in Fe-S cluster assembly, permease component|uniref:SufD family Fe-S cluster assembly protein n=1 Tax=Alistipes sp. TaxID=1872444 RepID=UPI001D5BB87F|nr:SufD family Fe-S cluster assembly protein [Alistipes sp.]MBS6099896.1 SufD family Fe-S cluster assembly protein [Alistipes sp.]HJI19097.1 SufD family Fe-S cluster assembly protein [Rikenellaceae bacterium]